MEIIGNSPTKRKTNDNAPKLLCCRACLSTDCKLLNIHEYNLTDMFSCISGSSVFSDGLPQHLCVYCSALLRKCMSFRAMCLWTQEHLETELLEEGATLTTDYIRNIDKPSNKPLHLSFTGVETIDCIETLPHDIKQELIIDIVDINSIINPVDLKTEPENEKDEEKLNGDTEDVVVVVREVKGIERKRKSEAKLKKNMKIENYTQENEIFDYEEDSAISQLRINIKEKKTKDVRVNKASEEEDESKVDNIDDDNVNDEEDIAKSQLKMNVKDKKRKDIRASKTAEEEDESKDDNIDDDNVNDEEDIAKSQLKMNVKVKKRKDRRVSKTAEEEDESKDDNIDDDNVNDEEDIAKSQLKMNVEDKKRKDKRVKKLAQEEGDNKDDNIDDENVNDVEPVKAKRKRKKKEVTRQFRKAENDFMPLFDFGKFEIAYGVRVVTLTKDEQLAEIEDRKTSANYLGSPFRCEDCGKGFLMEAAYNNHRKRHSPSIGPHSCEICSVRFKLQCHRQTHQDLHRLKFFCRECSFVSRNRHQAKQHHDVHAGKTFECQHCGKTFMKSTTHLSHVRLTHPAMNVACDICGETFIGQNGLKQHKTKMHSENVKPQQLKCPTCAATFVSLDALNRHTDTTDSHSDLSPCEQCGQNCTNEDLLQAHVRETHATEEHRCEECSQTFVSAASYSLHHRRKHLNEPFSIAGQRRPERELVGHFVCEQCGLIKTSATLLRHHQKIHRTVKPFPCAHCPKTFATKYPRNLHERTHTGERPFQCPLCPIAFTLKRNLKRHHKAVHLGLRKSIPCSICARSFPSGSALRVHVNTSHKGLPWPKRVRRKKNKDNGE